MMCGCEESVCVVNPWMFLSVDCYFMFLLFSSTQCLWALLTSPSWKLGVENSLLISSSRVEVAEVAVWDSLPPTKSEFFSLMLMCRAAVIKSLQSQRRCCSALKLTPRCCTFMLLRRHVITESLQGEWESVWYVRNTGETRSHQSVQHEIND